MKYTLTLLPCAMLFTLSAFAQRVTLIDSQQAIAKAAVLTDSGKFDLAINELLTIPRLDTNYVLSQSQLASLYRSNSKYDEAIVAADRVLKSKSAYAAAMICAKAGALDSKKEYDKALEILYKGLENYPFDVQMRFQVATTHHNKHDYEKAIKAYYDVLEIYPYSSATHLNLGHIAVLVGHKTQAMLSFGIYLSLKETDNAKLRYVESLASNQLEDEGKGAANKTTGNAFERIDQILQSKIAMDKKFKTEVPIDAATVKQFEMLLQQLSTASTSTDDPWLKFYGPVYAAIRDKKMVTPFLNHILSSAAIASVQKWNSKNEKSREAFFGLVRSQLTRDRGTIKIPASLSIGATAHAAYSTENRVYSLGDVVNGQPHGNYIYYHSNSEKSADGRYDNGKKIGLWQYYLDDGTPSSIENEDTGAMINLYPDGTKQLQYVQKNGNIEGEIIFYDRCGNVSEKRIHKEGKRWGKGQFFYENGVVKSDFEYVDDKLVGEWIDYDVYGHLTSKTPYKDGNVDGTKETFWVDGRLKEREIYVANALSGPSETRYANGRVHYKGVYAKGVAVGEWLYYNPLGELKERRFFNDEGNIDQENILYFEGKPYCKHTYKNGMIIQSIYLDKDGKEYSKSGSPDGTFEVKHFYETGELLWQGQYKAGHRNGKWTQYYREGNVWASYNYIDGEFDGEQIDFHRNGKKKVLSTYKNGARDGYVQEFYNTGQVSVEGWVVNDQRQQRWLDYSEDGSIAEDDYYLDDNVVPVEDSTKCKILNGPIEKFYPGGKTYSRANYVNDLLSGPFQVFDENGNPSTHGSYLNGRRNGTWSFVNEAGRPDQLTLYVNGSADSTLVNYYEFGSVYNTVAYWSGDRNGLASSLAPNGQPIVEKRYIDDELSAVRMTGKNGEFGEWRPVFAKLSVVAYYTNGQKAYEEEYVGGALSGTKRIYFPDGKPCKEYNYVDGEMEGSFIDYYPNGKVCMKGTNKFGERDGLLEIFQDNGMPMKTIQYKLGKKNGPTTLYLKGVKSKEVVYENDLPLK